MPEIEINYRVGTESQLICWETVVYGDYDFTYLHKNLSAICQTSEVEFFVIMV